jgi:LacI family transcriptional regulator
MVVGIKDIAAYLGLSTSTVSRALNGYDDVAAETVRRVRQASLQLGYFPSASARNLRRQCTDRIGLALLFGSAFTTSNEYFAEVIRLVAAAAEKHDDNLVLYTRVGDDPRKLARLAQTREVDGLILLGDVPGVDEAIQGLLAAQMPLVILGRPAEHLAVDYVTADTRQGARLALEHLAGLGHRRIGYISFSSASRYSLDRLAAYRAALAEVGAPFDERLVAYASLEPESGARAIETLLALPEPPTAVYVYNDRLAIEVLQHLSQRGAAVPKDLAVVGFDDIRAARHTAPPLTTIRYPLAEMAESAVSLLLARQAEPAGAPARLILPVELVVRQSTIGSS